MLCVRAPIATFFAACLLALMSYPAPVSAAEDKPKPQVLFTNVNVFDGKSDTLAEGMSVLVEGNLIKKIAKGKIKAAGAGPVHQRQHLRRQERQALHGHERAGRGQPDQRNRHGYCCR